MRPGDASIREIRPGAEVSDEQLAALARDGSEAAFAALMRRYEAPIYGYLGRMLRNKADADDAFQDTFLKVYANLDRFRASGRFRPWLYRIATNCCLDLLRRRKRRRTVSLDAPGPSDGPGAPALSDVLASHAPGPGEQADAAETGERLARAVARLRPKHRAVFVMAKYDHLAYDEIARALRVPVGTVKSRMNKAVNQVMRELEEGAS